MAEIEHGMAARELDNWKRYYSVEPFGHYRDNIHAAMLAAAVVNSSPNRKRGHVAKIADFMLRSPGDLRQSRNQKSLAFLRAVGRRVA